MEHFRDNNARQFFTVRKRTVSYTRHRISVYLRRYVDRSCRAATVDYDYLSIVHLIGKITVCCRYRQRYILRLVRIDLVFAAAVYPAMGAGSCGQELEID